MDLLDRIVRVVTETKAGRFLSGLGNIQLFGAGVGVIVGVLVTLFSPLLGAPIHLQLAALVGFAVVGAALVGLGTKKIARPRTVPAEIGADESLTHAAPEDQWVDLPTTEHLPPATKWLPDPADFSSVALTNADLEASLSRAANRVKTVLGPDAEADFLSISVGRGFVTVEFWGWSKLAGKVTTVTVNHDSVWDDGARLYEVPWGGDVGGDLDRSAKSPRWRVDKRWRDLIDVAWYRYRPQVTSLRVEPVESGWRVTANLDEAGQQWHVLEHRGKGVAELAYVSGPPETVWKMLP